MSTIAAAWFGVAFFLLPGFVISWVAGMRAPAALWAALPVTFGVIGMGGWMWGLTSAPFNLWTYGVSVTLALGIAAAWRYAFYRKARPAGAATVREALWPSRPSRPSRPSWSKGSVGGADLGWVIPTAGMVTGIAMAVGNRLHWMQRLPHGLWNIVQGWDVQWHANAVRFIMDTGVASATRMGELQNIESHAKLLYPVGFHAGTALFGEAAGLEPIPALNLAEVILPSLALPISMACLVMAFMRSRGMTAQIAAGLAAIFIYAAPQVLWVGDYVGMWPYVFAMSLTGIVIWQFVSVPAHHASALPAAIGFLGVLTSHPSAVTVVVLGVALSWLTSTLVHPERSRLSDTLWIGLSAVVASVAFVPQILAGSEQAEEVSGWQARETSESINGWESAFSMRTRHVLEFFPDYNPTVLLWLAGFGALVLVFWRRQVWPLLFYVVSLAAAANAVEPLDGWLGDALSVIGNLHYNTQHRLIFPVVMCVVAAAAIGVAAAIRLVTLAPLAARQGGRTWRVASSLAATVVAVLTTVWVVPELRSATDDDASRLFAAARTGGRMVSDDDLAAFTWLGNQPAARDGLTMGDPADGHSWLYAFNGVPTVSRHYLWPSDGLGSDFDVAWTHPDAVGQGLHDDPKAVNIADRAIEDLNIKFYIVSPTPFWAYQRPHLEMERALWASDAFTPVYRKGTVVVFAVNDQFDDKELRLMRADAVRSGSDELFELSATGSGQQ